MKKKEQEEESKGKRRRSGRIQKIHEQQLMESSSESSSESSTSEEESESEESSSEEISEAEEEQESNSDTEVEEETAIENKTPKKESKKQNAAKVKKNSEKPTPVPVEKKAGKRQPPSRKKQTSKSKPEEEKPENSRRSGRLRQQKNTRSQIDDRQSDSGIDESDKNCSDTDDDSRSVTSEISRRSTKSEISARSDSVKKELPKRNTRSDKKLGKPKDNEKPNTSKSDVEAEAKSVKGRGRPRKTAEQDDAHKDEKVEEHHVEDESETKSEKDSGKSKGRGRPRKIVYHEGSDDKKKTGKANNVENESDHENENNSEKANRGRRKSGKIVEHGEKNDDHIESESDTETKSEKDSDKHRSRGRPRKSAKLSKAQEAHENDDIKDEENHLDREDETEEKSETVMTRRRSLRHSTESNPNKNPEESEKNNDKTEIEAEKSVTCKENSEVKDDPGSKTEVKMDIENEEEISKDCDTTSTPDTSDKDTGNDSEKVKTETVNENDKTSKEKDFSEAKSIIKRENEIKDEKDVDSSEVKEEIIPDGEENEENKPKMEAADTEEIKVEETEEEKKLTPVQSPEVKPRPKPTPPPKSKTGSRWHLICATLDDWINLAEWFKESTARCEKALTKVIEEDFLPVLPEIIETREKEKERRQRENEQRKSARITQKQREKMEQEKILAEAAVAEEKARKEAEEERRLKEEHERLEHENKLREERVKAREERAKRLSMREERARLMAEGKDIPPELIYTGLPAQRYKDDFDSDDSKPDFLDDESFQSLQKVVDGMKNHKDSWPFLEPVTEEQAPGYHDVIKRPMDLSKIEKKVDLREYRTQHHFLSDFRLMFNNCRRFNGADSDFTDCAKTMEKHLKNLVKKHLLEQPTDSYYDDEDFVSSAARGGSQVEKKIRPKRQAGTRALQTVQKALKDDGDESSGEDVEVQTEPVKKRKILTEEAISPSVRSLLLQEMIEFKRKRAEQRASGQVVSTKPPTTQGIMIMPREEIPTDGVLRLAASREIRWKIDPNNVSLKKGLIDRGGTSTVVKTPETSTQSPRLGRPPISSLGQSPRLPISSVVQSPNVNPQGLASNSSPAVRPQNTLNVVHKKAVGLAPGQKIIKILASAPGTGIHAVRQTAESVKVSSDGFLILNGKPTSIKVTPNTKIVIQPQGAGDSQGAAEGTGQGSEGSGNAVGSPLGKEVVIKKIPTPAGLQPLSNTEASVTIQPIYQNTSEQVPRTVNISQNQAPQNHKQYNVKIGQGQPPARSATGNQQQGMVPGRVTVQTPRVVNVAGQQSVVPGSGTNPSQTMASNSIEARKQQLDIAQRLLAAKRRQLMQNGPISPKVARLEKDSSPLISSPNVALSRQGNVFNSNSDRENSLSSNVIQNVNISNDILDSYYSVMNEGVGQKTAEFTAVPLTSIQQSSVQGTSLTNVQQSVQGTPVNNVQQGVQGTSLNARNVAIPQHTPVNINRLLHSSPPKNSVIGTPVTVTKEEVRNTESDGFKTMSISALTTALARNIAAGNIQLNRTAPKGPGQALSSGQNTNFVNQNVVTSQTQSGSDSGNPVVINMDPKGGVTQQYLNVSQPVQTVIQSPQVLGQAVQYVSQPMQISNQSPQVIGQTCQIVNQPVLQKSQSVSSAISELLKSTVINNSVSNLLTTDSVGLQNQILSSLANVQTQQVQSLASVPQTQTYLTSIQNQPLSSQSQLKPIEALFTGQTTPVMLSSTNKVHQFSPYKPSVSNISPPKSDRQNLFDVFESSKSQTVVSPNKSDDFGFASLASDRIPLPVRQSGVPTTSDEVLSRAGKQIVRGNEFVGSPLNSSVMEALKSKLSPGKPLTGTQPKQVLNLEQYLKPAEQTVTSPLTMFSTIGPKVGVQDQTQGSFVNKQVVIGTLPDSLRQAQTVSISIAEDVPNWQQNSQTPGNVQSKVVVESLPNVQTLIGRSENVSAIEPNLKSPSTPLPVSNQVKTIESIFAGNDTNSSATSSIANLLAATIGQPRVSLGLENKPLQLNSPFSPQTLMNNATYVGSINVPQSQQVGNSGQTSTDSGQKLGALEAMFLKGINVEQTVISQTPVMTAPSEEVTENGDGSSPEIEFTAVKLDQT